MPNHVPCGPADSGPYPTFDPHAAREFLIMLDPTATAFHFAAFADGPKQRRKKIRPISEFGRFNYLACELTVANSHGAAVCVTANRTDGHGRKASNIVCQRTAIADFDDGLPVLPLVPSILVETSHVEFEKYQAYWLVEPNEVLSLASFDAIEARLVRDYRADPNAKDVARILRLPGFLHQKEPARPHMVRVVGGSGRRYTVAELVDAFPPLPPKPIPPPAPPLDCPADADRMRRYAIVSIRRVAAELALLTDGRRTRVFHAACRVATFAAHGIVSASEIESQLIAAWIASGADAKHGRAHALTAIRNGLAKGVNDALPDLDRKNRRGSK